MKRSIILLLAAIFVASAGPHDADAQSQYRQPDRRAEFGAWVVECFGPRLNQSCQVYQRVLMNSGRSVALVVAFHYPPNVQRMNFQIAVPLGIEISRNASLQIGPDFRTTLPVTRCTQQGCLLEGSMGPVIVDRLLQANAAAITVQNPGVGPFQIPLSLNGFAEALRTIAPPPPEPAQPATQAPDADAPAAADNTQNPQDPTPRPPTEILDPGDSPGLVAPLPQTRDNRLNPVTGSQGSN